jgi:hypothetical protein
VRYDGRVRANLIAAAFVLAGCNQVFAIRETELIDGGLADALPAGCRVTPVAVDKDTYLSDAFAHGREDAVRVDALQPGLFRFGIGVMPGERVAAAVLEINAVDRAVACGAGTGCDPCTTSATTYRVYWNESSWSDDDATKDNARASNPWQAELATGTDDRSLLVAEHTFPATLGTLALPIHMTEVVARPAEPWLRLDAGLHLLTLQMLTDGPITFASDDRDTGTCSDNLAPATLIVTLCQ